MKKVILINVFVIIFVFIVLLLIGSGLTIYNMITADKLVAIDPSDTSSVIVSVEEGNTPTDVLLNMYNEEIIYDYDAAYDYCIKSNCAVFPGNYEVSKSMRADDIIDYLGDSDNAIQGDFLVVREGGDLVTIADELSEVTDYSSEEIMEFWDDENNINSYINDYWYITDEVLAEDIKYPLEGYFPPLTYEIKEGQSLEEITNIILNYGLTEYAEYQDVDNGYTFHEMLTLGSIIERETIFDEDKPIVSEVFYNRIDNEEEYGKLQSDITVLYALGEHKEVVTYDDLEYDDPYNTYLYNGLTPGPIGSPSALSLAAAYNPDDNDYYYFFADSEGKVHYAQTLAEHEENICEYSPSNDACS